jgi:hypothetical protein
VTVAPETAAPVASRTTPLTANVAAYAVAATQGASASAKTTAGAALGPARRHAL